MRTFIRLIIVFAIAAGLAIGARLNPGNVVFFYPPTRIDLSLNFFLVLLFIAFVALYFIVRMLVLAKELPKSVSQYRQNKREKESNKALRESLKSLFEGRFGHAEKFASKTLDFEENKSLGALIGARAAHYMGQFERRNAWFARIEEDSSFKTARLVTMTELYVDQHQSENALEAVKELNASGKRHIQVLRWALKANQQAKNWNEVLKLVKVLDKNKALHPTLSLRLRELAYEALLKEHGHDAESLRQVWNEIPAAEKLNTYISLSAASKFNACELYADARRIVEKSLDHEWSNRLLKVYRDSAGKEESLALRGQIENCEKWLSEHPNNPELELTLGRLCLHQKLWGKARIHLENSLKNSTDIGSQREANLQLAQMHESLEKFDEAAKYYRQCALLVD